jgi:hypothetical protein
MCIRKFSWFSLVALILGGFAPAGQAAEESSTPVALVKEALAAMEKSKVNRWTYTMTSVVDGKTTVEKHDPAAPRGRRWELVSKDGKTPTDAERRDYAKKRKRESGMSQLNLKELVDLSSVRIEKEDEDQMTCTVRLKTDSQEIRTIAEKMKGQLVVRKTSPAIEAFEFINTERIGKRGVFSISELKVGMTYIFDPTVGELLPASFSMRLRGRALLVKSLNSDSEVTFSDFRRPEKPTASPTKAD